MNDLQKLMRLISEFLNSDAPSYKKLEACADIMRLAHNSYDHELKTLSATFTKDIDVFTRNLMNNVAKELRSIGAAIHENPHYRPTGEGYVGPSGLLSIEKRKKQSSDIDMNQLQTLAAMASELDKTGDPELIKEASVLDEILLTLAAPRDARMAFKLAEDQEIQRLREKYRSDSVDKSYKTPREELEKDLKTADAIKAIENSVKEYRPLEAALSTRTCPDHPGAQMSRITDSIYQCSLDKKVYNYQGGFTTMKGSKVPGGDVATQTQTFGDRAIEHMSFDSRESKLNGS